MLVFFKDIWERKGTFGFVGVSPGSVMFKITLDFPSSTHEAISARERVLPAFIEIK